MEYLIHLLKDKKFSALLKDKEPYIIRTNRNIFVYLCASIMSQQLSVRVADVIYERFLALYDGKEPAPQQVLDTDSLTLRNIGLSNNKVSYIKNVAAFAVDPGMGYNLLEKMDNEEIITYLTQIKGVGRWTVEMLLMSALGREDVFAVDDLGIQNAMISLYKLDRSDKKALREKMLKISLKWSPYRTYACRHLWSWKDNDPVKKKSGKEIAAKKKSPRANKLAVKKATSVRAKTAQKKTKGV
ncbi:MAG: DNA-3-methyladenine glycosylase 2 family protein [Chitinophagaceae bacterium]|nr:MAG: DNA-3-methyladenine glycosylase 2 family protein [Chitinophagaceae bacterium]